MDRLIEATAFVLGDNIDTDQIIPAEYLSYNPSDPNDRKFFAKYALSGVPIAQSGLPKGHTPFVPEGTFHSPFGVIVGGRNFGCGSSREHAPLAIAEAGCKFVVAESYARIFYRNSVNGGYLIPLETTQRLADKIATGSSVKIDLASWTISDLTTGQTYPLKPLGDVAEIIEAGGLFAYAKQASLMGKS